MGLSLAVQWLRLQATAVGGMSLIPSWRTTILHVSWQGQKINKSFLKNKNPVMGKDTLCQDTLKSH